MTRVSPAAFRDLLDDLDDEELAAFVAAVYDARGWETDRVDGGVVTTPPGEERPRRFTVPSATDPDRSDGRVIATPETADAAPVTADDLREMVSYALDAADANALFRRFFDRDIDGVTPPDDAVRPGSDAGRSTGAGDAAGASASRDRHTGSATSETTGRATGETTGRATDETTANTATASSNRGNAGASATTREGTTAAGGGERRREADADGGGATGRPSPRSRWLAAGLVLAIVGAVVLASGPALTSPAGEADEEMGTTEKPVAASGGTDTATPTGDDDSEPLPAALEPMRAPPVEGPFPPGLDERGVTDASRLADAHEEALSDRSFQLRIAYHEFVDGELRGVAHERVAVAGPGRYRSDVHTLGTLEHESTIVASGSSFGNGTTRFVRPRDGAADPDGVRIDAAEPDRFVDRTERYVRWYLSVEESRIVGSEVRDGTKLIRIVFDGDPWPQSSDTVGWALVDRQGMVREIHREYSPTDSPSVHIETTITVGPGEAPVSRPRWVDTALANGTTNRSYGQLPPSLEGRSAG